MAPITDNFFSRKEEENVNVVTRDPRRQVFATDTDWTQSMGPAVGADDDDDDNRRLLLLDHSSRK